MQWTQESSGMDSRIFPTLQDTWPHTFLVQITHFSNSMAEYSTASSNYLAFQMWVKNWVCLTEPVILGSWFDEIESNANSVTHY